MTDRTLLFILFMWLAFKGTFLLVEDLCLTIKTSASSKMAIAWNSLRDSFNGSQRPSTSATQNPKGSKKARPANGVELCGLWAKAVYGLGDTMCQVIYTCDYDFISEQVGIFRCFPSTSWLGLR